MLLVGQQRPSLEGIHQRPVQGTALLGRTAPPSSGQVAWRKKMGTLAHLWVPPLYCSTHCLIPECDPLWTPMILTCPPWPQDSDCKMWDSYSHTASRSWRQVLGFLHLHLTARWTLAAQSDPLHPGPSISGRYRWTHSCPFSIPFSLVERSECLLPTTEYQIPRLVECEAQDTLPAALEH